MKLYFTSLFLILFIAASHAQESYLIVSSGGGVAGTTAVYKISPDGKVLKGKGLGEINYIGEGKLGKCSTKKYFKQARKLMTPTADFNHPGNLYSSITLFEQGKESKITWGDTEHAAPEDAKKLYEKINTKMTKLTFATDTRK